MNRRRLIIVIIFVIVSALSIGIGMGLLIAHIVSSQWDFVSVASSLIGVIIGLFVLFKGLIKELLDVRLKPPALKYKNLSFKKATQHIHGGKYVNVHYF